MIEKTPNNFIEELINNPILASLLLLNPISGLSNLGYSTHETGNVEQSVSAEDALLARDILENDLRIPKPQIIQVASDEDLLLRPRITSQTFNRNADISINISTEILKYSLTRFSKSSFASSKIENFPSGDWWQLHAAGENISLEIDENGITLLAQFQCELSIDFNELNANKLKFPLILEILPAFTISGNQLYLSISKGQISISNFYYPVRFAEEFSNAIARSIPYIPICTIPTQFELRDHNPHPTVLLTDANVEVTGISLSFHIDEEFSFDANSRSKPFKKKKGKDAASFLTESWIGQENLWNYDNYGLTEETHVKSCGSAVMATISDFFGRNSFSLEPIGEPAADGRVHYETQKLVGSFFDWYYPRFSTIGKTEISAREDLVKAFTNMKLALKEFNPKVSEDGLEAQRVLIEWIVKTQLPVVVLVDVGKLTVLENLATGENDARPEIHIAHWGLVYAVNDSGVKFGSWGNEYFIPWEIFMKAWNCDFLPHPNNFYQIQIWE